jgi:hypothetical protein
VKAESFLGDDSNAFFLYPSSCRDEVAAHFINGMRTRDALTVNVDAGCYLGSVVGIVNHRFLGHWNFHPLPALRLLRFDGFVSNAYQDDIVALQDASHRELRKEEAFLDISLDVRPTLEDALALLVQSEVLKATEGNGWRPEKGAPAVDAEKGIQLQSPTLPSILQLHLKRFQFDWNTETTTKINAPCVFPVVLDLAPFCGGASRQPEEQNVLYDLQGIVVHAGEYGQGHYYAYVRPDVQ